METLEACSESCRIEHEGVQYDALLIAAPILAWTRFSIASGTIAPDMVATLSAHLFAHVLASNVKMALARYPFSIDQMPRSHGETLALTQKLAQAALKGSTPKAIANAPETAPFLADTRYLLAAVVVPAGEPLFHWQTALNFAERETALEQWRKQAAPNITKLLPGCGIEIVAPMNGPITPTIELSAVHVPIALARSSSGNTWMITANALGVTSAAHTPCIARNAHSSGIEDAIATESRSEPKPGNANQEHTLLTEYISKRSPDQQQRRGASTGTRSSPTAGLPDRHRGRPESPAARHQLRSRRGTRRSNRARPRAGSAASRAAWPILGCLAHTQIGTSRAPTRLATAPSTNA